MTGKTLLSIVPIVFCLGAGIARAQADHGHHQPATSAPADVSSDTSAWGEVDESVRIQFDSAYVAARRNPAELDGVYGAFLSEISAKAILQYLESRYSYCHPLAHDLGVAVYRRFGNLGVAVHECGDGCSSACMHGAVREAFGGSSVEQIVASVDSVCAIDGMAEINRPANCAHALGHALMMATDNSLRASLDGCAMFPGQSRQHYCATGVFMEFGADRSGTERPVKEGELVSRYPCDEFGDFAAACYRYVVPRMRRSLDTRDPKVLAAECRKLDYTEQLGCFRGLGVAFAGMVRSEPHAIHDVCEDTETNNVLVCIDALVEQVAYRRPEEAAAICAELHAEANEVCEAALTGRYQLDKPIMDVYLRARR